MKFFYALSDWSTGNYPKEYQEGFANTKRAIAFTSRKERDAWLDRTKLIGAKAIYRTEAIKHKFKLYSFEGKYVSFCVDYVGDHYGLEIVTPIE